VQKMLSRLSKRGVRLAVDDFGRALKLFSESRDEFDMWFKQRLADSTGVDLNNPPEMKLPELLSSYST